MPILSLKSAKAKILEILESGYVQTGFHCQEQMRDREFLMPDILRVLQTGEVKPGGAAGDEAKGIFRVYGHDNEGNPLALVVEIDEKRSRLRIITGFGY
jgi:hypothetical protein